MSDKIGAQHRRLADSQYNRRFGRRQIFRESQHEHAAIVGRKLIECFAHPPPQFVLGKLLH